MNGIKTMSNKIIIWFVVAVIVVLTALASYPSVMEYESMFLDDMGRFDLALKNKIHPQILERNFFRAYVMYAAYELMTIDLSLARAYILLFMIGSSLAFFYILHHLLKPPLPAALVASVLPNLLPGIEMIPGFIDGSYTVPGQFVLFLSIIAGLLFLGDEKFRWGLLLLSVFLYYAAIEMMDQSIFMILVVVFIFAYKAGYRFTSRLNTICVAFVVMAIQKIVIYFMKDQPSYMSSQSLTLAEIQNRFFRSLHYVTPIEFNGDLLSGTMSVLTVVILVSGAVFYLFKLLKKDVPLARSIGFTGMGDKSNGFLVLLGLVWFISSGAVFWVTSPYFSNRYFHLPAFGAALIFAYVVQTALVIVSSSRVRQYVVYGVVALFLISTACVRFTGLRTLHAAENRYYDLIKNTIMQHSFPENAQIIISGATPIGTGGYWWYSSGYLKFLTGREDIDGVLSFKELQYYDAFRVQDRGFTMRMSGNDLKRPVFLYRITSSDKIERRILALRWKASRWTDGVPGRTHLGAAEPKQLKTSDWEVLQFDTTTGQHRVFASGKGLDAYQHFLNTLDSKGLTPNDIMFNGVMTDETRKRFGL